MRGRAGGAPLDQGASGSWDVIVVGAGLAGLAALRAALDSELRVLLIESGSAPRKQIGSGVLSYETGRLIEQHFGIDMSSCQGKGGFLKGAKLHLTSNECLTSAFEMPAYNVDRQTLLSTLLKSLGETPALFRTRVLRRSEDKLGERQVLELERRGQRLTMAAPLIIDACGRTISGLPSAGTEETWNAEARLATHFVARLTLEARLPDPGWYELRITKDAIAYFYNSKKLLTVELLVPSARTWQESWNELLGYLNSQLGIRVQRERSASFQWVSRPSQVELGQQAVLKVGDAAGLSSALGYGLHNALLSGLAAGKAASFVALNPDPLTVYKRELKPVLEELEVERSEASLRSGAWRLSPAGLSFKQLFAQAPVWKRWRGLREVRTRLERVLSINPKRPQLPDTSKP